MSAYTDEHRGWRRLACRLLLDGALGAHAHNPLDVAWVNSDSARTLAELVGLPHWPPRREQLVGARELTERARELNPADDFNRPGQLGTTTAEIRRRARGSTSASERRQARVQADAAWG